MKTIATKKQQQNKVSNLSMKISVLGAGAWGSALVHHLISAGHEVTVWGRNYQTLLELSDGVSKKHPDLKLNSPLRKNITTDLQAAVLDAEIIVSCVPSLVTKDVFLAISNLNILNLSLIHI